MLVVSFIVRDFFTYHLLFFNYFLFISTLIFCRCGCEGKRLKMSARVFFLPRTYVILSCNPVLRGSSALATHLEICMNSRSWDPSTTILNIFKLWREVVFRSKNSCFRILSTICLPCLLLVVFLHHSIVRKRRPISGVNRRSVRRRVYPLLGILKCFLTNKLFWWLNNFPFHCSPYPLNTFIVKLINDLVSCASLSPNY